MESGLGCDSKKTAAEQKETFHAIVRNAIGPDEEKGEDVFLEIQEGINCLIEEQTEIHGKSAAPAVLTKENIHELMAEIEIPEAVTAKIEQSFAENFGDMPPAAEYLIDTKALAANAEKKKSRL